MLLQNPIQYFKYSWNHPPLTSIAETTLKLRSDEVKSKNIRDQIIKNSPQDNEDYFVVPKVIE